MNLRPHQIFWLLCLLLISSCQAPRHLVLDPVGPTGSIVPTGSLALAGTGFLKVYLATETRHADKFINYYPHTSYLIYATNGNMLRWVQNAVASTDENPALVSLPAGFYTVRAEDDDYGRVFVPIVIEGGQTTTVFLEARRIPSTAQLNATNSVRLPNGRMVGWRTHRSEQKTGIQ